MNTLNGQPACRQVVKPYLMGQGDETHTKYGILHSTWNFGRFPLPLQPIKTTGTFIGSIVLIFNYL
jgi:hypothetical protein